MRRHFLTAAFCLALPLAAEAQAAFEMPEDEAAASFVASNIVATFYHELGHAMIDVLDLSVLGREEDAADTLSTILIHEFWQEDAAVAMVYDSANGFLLYAAEAEAGQYDTPYWDEHSLDMQRYYNLACLFYGANPDERDDIAQELGLPEDRAARCPDEYQLAADSWGTTLDALPPADKGKGLRLIDPDENDPIKAMLAEEIDYVNKSYGLPQEITVQVADCGEANAFYSPDDHQITMCTEYATDLVRVYATSE